MSVCLFVCPSVLLSIRSQLCFHWMGFREIWSSGIFRKSVQNIPISLKSDKNGGCFTRSPVYIYDSISLNSSQNEKCVRQKLQRKSKNTFYVQQLIFENRAFYEIMWNNIAEQGRPQVTIRSVRIARWIKKATNTHPEYVIIIAFPL
jgi:hypothetical protein